MHEQDLFWMTVKLARIKVIFSLPQCPEKGWRKSHLKYLIPGVLREYPMDPEKSVNI